MGFYSWNCRGCGESMKAPYDLPKKMEWQNKVVVLTEFGQTLKGDYDGYGRGGWEDIESDRPECWHQECYEVHGEPKKYSEPSQYASDQGFFYEEN